MKKIGVKKKWEYPDRFDIIWAIKPPYEKLDVIGSEDVPGLDDKGVADGSFGAGPATGGGVSITRYTTY